MVAGVAAAAGVAALAAMAADGDETSTTSSTTPGSAIPTCEDTTLVERHVIVCTAEAAAEQGLIVALHGRGSSAEELRAVTELDRYAAEEGFAVAYPDALDGGWGDDTFTTPSRPAGDEDVRFLDDLIAALRSEPGIDGRPVGVVGFSNGGSMAMRYAAERPDDLRAVVAVAGQLPRDPAVRPTRPVPLLAMYGTADPLRSYDAGIPDPPHREPGQPTPTLSTPETVAAFVATAPSSSPGEPTESDADPADGTRLRTERWADDARTTVVFHTLVDAGHTWPSAHAPQPEAYGVVSGEIDASAEAIRFIVDPRGPAGTPTELAYTVELPGYELADQSVGVVGEDGFGAVYVSPEGREVELTVDRGRFSDGLCRETPLRHTDPPTAPTTCERDGTGWYRAGGGRHEHVVVRGDHVLRLNGPIEEVDRATLGTAVSQARPADGAASDPTTRPSGPVERGDLPATGDGAPDNSVGPGG